MTQDSPRRPSSAHQLLTSAGTYTVTNVVNKAIPFLLLPVLTRYLTPADYGVVALFQVFVQILLAGVGLNATGLLSVNYYRLDGEQRRRLVQNILTVTGVTAAMALAAAVVGRSALGAALDLPAHWIYLGVGATAAQFIVLLVLTIWQMEDRPGRYGMFQVALTCLNVAVSLYLVVDRGEGWSGRLTGIVVGYAAFALIGLVVLARRGALGLRADRAEMQEIRSFGVPLIPHALGAWAFTATDRLFIKYMVGVAATGEYVVGYQVGMVIGLLQDAFNRAWSPYLFRKLTGATPDDKRTLVRFTYWYFAAILGAVGVLSAVAPTLMRILVSRSFFGAYRYIFWVALGYGLNGMYKMVVNYVFFVKQTHILAWLTMAAAAINVVLNWILIRANGPIGAAQATTVTFGVLFLAAWVLSAKVFPMPWRLR